MSQYLSVIIDLFFRGGMAVPRGKCPNHGMVAGIAGTIAKTRPARPINKSLRAEFRQPGGSPVERGLEELTEEYRRSPEFQRMAGGAVLAVPVCELRLMELPAPNRRTGEHRFKEGKVNWIDSEGMWTSMEDIKDTMETKYRTLEGQGVDAKNLIKKTAEYIKYNLFLDQHAEVIAKNALRVILEETKKPALLTRGLKLNKSTIKYMQTLGVLVEMPTDDKKKKKIQDWEGDLVAAVLGKDKLHIILGEVKRKNFSPNKTGKQDMRELISHALEQLKKDVLIIKVSFNPR